ncbi:MAG: hypothetical protein ACXQT2_04430 [Methanotrichaceae archaeon]
MSLLDSFVSEVCKVFGLDPALVRSCIVKVDGAVFVNCTPHYLVFEDGKRVNGYEDLARLLRARVAYRRVRAHGNIEFVKPFFEASEDGLKLVDIARSYGIYLIGSTISAQSYGYPVVSPIATPETSAKPPEERRIYRRRWNCWW